MPPSAIRARFDGGFLQITCLAYCALRIDLTIAIGVLKILSEKTADNKEGDL